MNLTLAIVNFMIYGLLRIFFGGCMKKQQGFTLIELIIVIVILGILAATAIPKYIDFASQARFASIRTVRGAVVTAASVVNKVALTAGAGSIGNNVITADGIKVFINATTGYPIASNITNAMDIDLGGYDVSLGSAGNQIIISTKGKSSCNVTYDETQASLLNTVTMSSSEQC